MLRHIVLLRLVDDVAQGDVDAIVDALSALPASVSGIRRYEVRRDVGLAPDNAQLVVLAEFDDTAGYDAYRDHPEHRRIIHELIRPVLASRSAAQLELDPDDG